MEPSTNVSLETLKLIVEGLWIKFKTHLTLDIENVLFFILSIRFVILAIRYLKTSLYITGIGLLQHIYGIT
jgi:hypothetical protein